MRPTPVIDRQRRRPEDAPTVYGATLTPWEAMHFLLRPTLDATLRWFSRHGIIRRGDGAVDRRDLERELARMQRHPRRGRHPHSRANLQRGRAA